MSKIRIQYTDTEIRILDSHGEIVSWTEEEWIEDPQVVFSIVNAVRLGTLHGGDYLRRKIRYSS